MLRTLKVFSFRETVPLNLSFPLTYPLPFYLSLYLTHFRFLFTNPLHFFHFDLTFISPFQISLLLHYPTFPFLHISRPLYRHISFPFYILFLLYHFWVTHAYSIQFDWPCLLLNTFSLYFSKLFFGVSVSCNSLYSLCLPYNISNKICCALFFIVHTSLYPSSLLLLWAIPLKGVSSEN